MVDWKHLLLLQALILHTAAYVCPFDALGNADPTVVHPAYTVEQVLADMDNILRWRDRSCVPTMDIYRAYEGGAVRRDDLTSGVNGPCQLSTECTYTKPGNSLQASTCSDLLTIRNEILSTSYTALCRHEMTNWNLKPAERTGCEAEGTCTKEGESEFKQRLLSPAGWRRSFITGQSLKKSGISIEKYHSSGYKRSKDTANAISQGLMDESSNLMIDEEDLDNAVHNYRNYERIMEYTSAADKGKEDASLLIRARMRQWLVKDWDEEETGKVRLGVSHGGSMQATLSVNVDEGDCVWVKPASETYGNEEALDVQLSTKTFTDEFQANTPRIDLFAILSPEQMQKMAQCNELSQDMKSVSSDKFLCADTNYDLKISKEEFDEWCEKQQIESERCKVHWPTILRLQARPYWKSKEEVTSFHIGEHAYFNGGFMEVKYSQRAWAFPYRATTLDTIRPTVKEAQTLLQPIDLLIRAAATEVDSAKLLDCPLTKKTLDIFRPCTERKDLLKYKTLPTRDFPDDHVFGTNVFYSPDFKYPYNTTIDITPVENPMVKLVMCLFQEGHGSIKEMAASMECSVSSKSEKKRNKKAQRGQGRGGRANKTKKKGHLRKDVTA